MTARSTAPTPAVAPAIAGPAVRRAGGQALVETLAACLLLVPLWLAVFYISRWHDLQFTTINAARYAAFESWETAGIEPAARTEAVTRERLFSRSAGRFTASGAPDAARGLGDVAQWRDHADGEPLLDLQAPPSIRVAGAAPPESVQAIEALGFDLITPALVAGTGSFDLQRDAVREAVVRAPLRFGVDLPGRGATEFMTLQERQVLLVDTWAASGPTQLVRRIDALSPAGRLRELAAPLRPLRWAIRAFEPAFDQFCPGRPGPDLVPPDRLVGGNRIQFDLRQEPCP